MLYEITLRQELNSQQVINRFHYLMGGTPAGVSGSFALTSAFGLIDTAGVFPAGLPFRELTEVQSNALTHLEADIRAMYDVEDFYTRPFIPPKAGAQLAGAFAPFVAYGLQTSRTTLAVRRGSKRIAGVTEDAVDAGGNISAGIVTALGELADALTDVLTYDDEGNTITFSPVILKFEKYTTPSGKDAYRPYATLALQLEHKATGIQWSPMPQVRSQVSRQYRRGR